MTALSHAAVAALLTEKNPGKRLFVCPLLDPAQQLQANQVGIDVRMGRVVSLVRAWTQGVAESLQEDAVGQQPLLESVVLEFGQPVIVHPHQFLLARTLEVFRLPPGIMAYVVCRSSWGRRGLTVATAVAIHPGFAGPITLEIKNVGEVPLSLYPFDRIAQLIFHRVDTRGSSTPQRSQFHSAFIPSLGYVRDKQTADRLIRIAEKRDGRLTGGEESTSSSESPDRSNK